MTSITRRLFLSLPAALAPGAAIAHHGWGGYDTSKSFTLTGKILKSTYENPHCEIEMEIDGKHWALRPGAAFTHGAARHHAGHHRGWQDLHRVRLSPYQQSGRGADRIHHCRRQARRIAVD